MKEPWVGLNVDRLLPDTSTTPQVIRIVSGKTVTCFGHRNRESQECLYCKIEEYKAALEYVEANTKEPAILYVVSEVLREEK